MRAPGANVRIIMITDDIPFHARKIVRDHERRAVQAAMIMKG